MKEMVLLIWGRRILLQLIKTLLNMEMLVGIKEEKKEA